MNELIIDILRIEMSGLGVAEAERYQHALTDELQRQFINVDVSSLEHDLATARIEVVPRTWPVGTTVDTWAVGTARQIVQSLIDACGIEDHGTRQIDSP